MGNKLDNFYCFPRSLCRIGLGSRGLMDRALDLDLNHLFTLQYSLIFCLQHDIFSIIFIHYWTETVMSGCPPPKGLNIVIVVHYFDVSCCH